MRQRKKHDLDVGEDWFASEVRREKRLERWGGESLRRNATALRDYHDAEKLAAEHREHCAAEEARVFHNDRCSLQDRMPSQSRPAYGKPQSRSQDQSGLSIIAIVVFFVIFILNLIF